MFNPCVLLVNCPKSVKIRKSFKRRWLLIEKQCLKMCSVSEMTNTIIKQLDTAIKEFLFFGLGRLTQIGNPLTDSEI